MTKLTAEEVERIVGREQLDDEVVAEILKTGATVEELIEALERLARGGMVGAETLRPMSAKVAQLYDILAAGEDDWSDWERP